MSATIEREFLEFMHQVITIEPLTGRDPQGGEPTYGPPQRYRGRIVDKNQLVVDAEGQERLSRTTVWVYGAPMVGGSDRVTLPDGRQPFILNVSRFPDEKGQHHTRIDFA